MGRATQRKALKRLETARVVILDLDELALLIRGCRRLAHEFPLRDANAFDVMARRLEKLS